MADGWFNAAGLRAAYTLVFGTKTIFIPKVSLVDSSGNPVSGGGAATIADGADVAEGATTAAAYTDTTGAAAGTVVGLLKGWFKLFAARMPATLGSQAAATSLATTQSTEDAALFGSLTETAPATDTASSGLNGRLQRIAQRLTTIIAGLSIKPLPSATATITIVSAAAADTSIFASNANRLPGSAIVNDSTSIMYVLLGSGVASVTNYTYAIDGKTTVPGYLILPDGWVGAVRAYWVTATGSARVTELSA